MGSGDVIGIIVIYGGEEGILLMNIFYRIYNVVSNGLFGIVLVLISVFNNEVFVDGILYVVMFFEVVFVVDVFFVFFDLGDYVYNNLGIKKIVLIYSFDGIRFFFDFDVFGRNVICWYVYGDVVWKDYRIENFESY